MRKWPKVKLKGSSQQIPSHCPNCLKPAEVEYRYCYTHPLPLYLLDRTRYWQTFYYCRDCGKQLDVFFRKEKWTGWMIILAIIGSIAAIAAIIGVVDAVVPYEQPSDATLRGWMMGAGALIYAALLWLFFRWLRRFFMRKSPQQPHQSAWGPAAYYVGDGTFGFGGSQTRVYRAARPEWLRELVERNPDEVDEATYLRVVGRAKASAEAAKPFTG